jgi:hypothetical protein
LPWRSFLVDEWAGVVSEGGPVELGRGLTGPGREEALGVLDEFELRAARTFCTSAQSVRAVVIAERLWRLTRSWHEAG